MEPAKVHGPRPADGGCAAPLRSCIVPGFHHSIPGAPPTAAEEPDMQNKANLPGRLPGGNGPCAQNKANLRLAQRGVNIVVKRGYEEETRVTAGRKQSQFVGSRLLRRCASRNDGLGRGPAVRNKANSLGSLAETLGHFAKQSQFAHARRYSPSVARAKAHFAKQSQFGPIGLGNRPGHRSEMLRRGARGMLRGGILGLDAGRVGNRLDKLGVG